MSDQTDTPHDHSPPDHSPPDNSSSVLDALVSGDTQLLEYLIESSSDGILAFDCDFRYLVWSRAMERLTGMKRNQVIGQDLFELFPNVCGSPDDASIRATLQGQTSAMHEGPFYIQRTGREGFYEAHYSPLYDRQNQIIGGLGIIRDITHRKRAEAEHEELVRQQIVRVQLENAERRFRSLFDQSPLSTQLLSPDGRTIRVNRAWEKLWGLTLQDLANYNILEDEQLVEKGVMPILKRGFAGEMASIPAIYYEPNLNAPESRGRWVEGFVYPLIDEAGNITEVVVRHQDVSDRKRVEDLLHERARHAALRADVSFALGQRLGLQETLQSCTGSLVQHLDATFARIWILDREENVLCLCASAGINTQPDGEHARIAVGQHLIGAIAEDRKPILINGIADLPDFAGHEWAEYEGMTSVAGYPLIADNEVVGVMAIFSRHELSHDVLDALSTIADVIAQGVEHSRIEDELRESEARYRTLFDTNPAPALVYDEKTVQILAVNQAAIEHYGYSHEEFLQLTMKDIRPLEDVPAFMERLASLNPTTRHVGVWRHRKKNGSIMYVEIKTSPLFFEGQHARITIVNDVTQRKKVEESQQLLAKAGAILGSSLDYQETLQSVAQLAVPFLADWCVVDIAENQTLRRLAIAHVDPEKEKLAWEIEERYPVDINAVQGPANVWRTGQSEIADIPEDQLEQGARDAEHLRFLRAMGLKSYICVPMHSRGRSLGAITFIAAESNHSYTNDDLHLAQDLAARAANAVENARLYHEAQHARQEAETANRAKDEFLAVVSHELRTPLNAILGWSSMLRSGYIDAETSVSALETIERNARAQAQLIEDILDVSRIITGKLHLNLGPTNLHDVIESAAATVKPAAQAKEIRLYLAFNASIRPIQGDSARLQQVVWNLLINAIKFTPRGGRIQVNVEETDGWQEIVVQDSGEGIAPEFLPFVFDRFRQADSSSRRQHGGLGLGLALVRHITEMHGGHVDVFSEGIGRGATFKVFLPLLQPSSTSADSAQHPEPQQPNVMETSPQNRRKAMLQGHRILVVDDDPEARALMRTVLETAGSQVMTADSAEAGLQMLTQSGSDLLLSDIGMPGQDGYSLMHRVRALPSAVSHVPAVALTAYAGEQDRQRATSAGFDYFMAKPIEPEALLKLVVGILASQKNF